MVPVAGSWPGTCQENYLTHLPLCRWPHRLTLTATVMKQKGQIWKQRGEATVDGARVAEAEFLATVVERDKA